MESNPKHIKENNNDPSSSSSGTQNLLLPGLPNDLAERCLSSLPPSLLFSVCHSWRRLLYSPNFPPFLSLYVVLSPLPEKCNDKATSCNSIEFFSLDPISSSWIPLPRPPQNPPLRLVHRHPSFLSRKLPIQSLTVSNNLVLIAATTPQFVPALSCPLAFNSQSNNWFFGPKFSIPRRWCAAGSVGGAVYIASGVGQHYRGDIGRSMEEWDLKNDNWKWEKKAQLRDGRFSREATEAVGFKGKLCMVNVKGSGAKEGAVYEVESNKWKEMPAGMLAGWNGPAATMNEDEMYVVDETRGTLNKYDTENDRWKEVIELPDLKLAEQIAAARGKVCAACANGKRIVVVDVVSEPVRIWMVDPPRGFEVVAVHVLPRMSKQN